MTITKKSFKNCILPLLLLGAFLGQPSLTLSAKQDQLLNQLLALPEEWVKNGVIALQLEKEIDPSVDVNAYGRMIFNLAWRVLELIDGSEKPLERIWAMNTVLFDQVGFQYDIEGFNEGRPEANYLHSTLDTGKGSCYALTNLYLAVAQRLTYPIYPVHAPGHYFLRYEKDGYYYNIDATEKGKHYPDETYQKALSISQKSIYSGAYLRTLSYREYMAAQLAGSAEYFRKKGRLDKALPYAQASVKLDPQCPDCHMVLAVTHVDLSTLTDSQEALEHYAQAEAHEKRTEDLDWTSMSEVFSKNPGAWNETP